MKHFITALSVIAIIQTVTAQSVNFTGKWNIDISVSNFGEAPLFVVPAELSVRQNKDTIYLSAINIDANGNKLYPSAKYPLNGSKVEKEYQAGVKLVGSFQFSEDQKQLLKDQAYTNATNGKVAFRKVKEVWTLSQDGQYLTIKQTVEIVNGDGYKVKAVYKKS